jgi:hypothetical protein
LTVHKQNESVIGAHTDGIAGWNGRQFDRAPKVQDHGFPERGRWMGDPRGFPLPMRGIGLGRILSAKRKGSEDEDDCYEDRAHRIDLTLSSSTAYRKSFERRGTT